MQILRLFPLNDAKLRVDTKRVSMKQTEMVIRKLTSIFVQFPHRTTVSSIYIEDNTNSDVNISYTSTIAYTVHDMI